METSSGDPRPGLHQGEHRRGHHRGGYDPEGDGDSVVGVQEALQRRVWLVRRGRGRREAQDKRRQRGHPVCLLGGNLSD